MKRDEFPVEFGGVMDDGRALAGITVETVRAKIMEGIARGRMVAAVYELPDGNVSIALTDPHATRKLIIALRRCADAIEKANRVQ